MWDLSSPTRDQNYVPRIARHILNHWTAREVPIYHFFLKVEKFKCLILLLFSRLAVSDSLWPHGLQHSRLPCPSLSPGVCSNSRPLSRWCYATFVSSVTSSSPAFNLSQHQGLFQWVFTSVGQSIGASALAPVLPVNIQSWFPLGLISLISLLSKELSMPRDWGLGSFVILLGINAWPDRLPECTSMVLLHLPDWEVLGNDAKAETMWSCYKKNLF